MKAAINEKRKYQGLEPMNAAEFLKLQREKRKIVELLTSAMHLLKCQEIAELKAFILENSDEFAVAVREQIVLLHDFEDKMHESDDEK